MKDRLSSGLLYPHSSEKSPIHIRFSMPIQGLKFYMLCGFFQEGEHYKASSHQGKNQTVGIPDNQIASAILLLAVLTSLIGVLSLFSSLFTLMSTTPPSTAISWITDQNQCENSGRQWRDDQCWDDDQSPMF